MNFRTRLSAAALCVCLLTSVGAAAAEPDADARREDLDYLYATLQKAHPNIYAKHSAAEFEAKITEIEGRLDTGSDLSFALELQSLVAMVADSHTTLSIRGPIDLFPFSIDWMEGRWVLTLAEAAHKDALGQTVTALNGFSMEEVSRHLSTVISADNEPALRKRMPQMVAGVEILTHLGLAEEGEPLTLTVADSGGAERSITMRALTPEQADALPDEALFSLNSLRRATAPTDYQKKYYFSLPLDANTYYIQYNTCQEDENLPMETFAAQVAADLEAGSYRQLLIDLRNNGGGSDGVLYPILAMLPDLIEDGVRVYGLIGEATFSSACINAVEIQDLGGLLAGSVSGASVNHFGAVRSFTLPNSGLTVSHSTKYIDLNTIVEARQVYGPNVPLTPDVVVDQTVSDLLAGRDTVVEELLKNGAAHAAPALPDAPLTRGRLAGLLYADARKTGATADGLENPFQDLFPLSWYVDGIRWCASVGVVQGGDDTLFAATRPITVQEAALMLTRYAAHMGRTPDAARTGAPGWTVPPAPWAQEAVAALWGWGCLDTGFDPAGTLTRAQGLTLVEAVSR